MERDDTDAQSAEDVAGLRLLRRLVIALTAVMIVGIATLTLLFALRFPGVDAPVLPEAITIPSGERVRAVTAGPDWYAVVTEAGEILIFSRSDNALRQRVQIVVEE